ncbi:MAG: DNA polymerase III subunit gamma/tau [Nitrospirota bacterium]|nr:DNA polymerase III subunit gamma/tau [Nitrospirota bacterium]
MSYLVLARKWRPNTFDDLVGQEPIARMLKNALLQGKISHAYIFSGPRGVGKTSTARILAKALNCKEGPATAPCGICASCTAVTEGSSVDVIEIDGASNNSVDDVRDLRERVKYAPSGGKYKVYIIDEVHMLSGSAFNALLKTLEEPPPHVIFVLATTEMKKIPATVISRCQHMPFRRIATSVIKARLQQIADIEKISISSHALGLVAKAADGSMRDSLTILDQVSSFSDEINEEQVQNLLGLTDFGLLSKASMAIITGSRIDLIEIIESLSEQGFDIRAFAKELAQFFRDLLIASVVKQPGDVLELSNEELAAVRELVAASSEDQLTLILSDVMKAEAEVRNSSLPRIALEMALIRASFLSSLKPVREIIKNLDSLSRGLPIQTPIDEPIQERPETALINKEPDKRELSNDSVKAFNPPLHPLPKAPTVGQEGNSNSVIPSKVPSLEGQWGGSSVLPKAEPPAALAQKPASETQIAEPLEEYNEATPLTNTKDEESFEEPLADSDEAVLPEKEKEITIIWQEVLDNIDAPLASKLEHAAIELTGDQLQVTLQSSQALFIDTIRKSLAAIEKTLSEHAGRNLSITLSAQKKKAAQKNDLKKKASDEPIIKEALELFEGRIIDVISVESHTITNTRNGGVDV